jgi:MauM/NapG family ferredoxin protein
MLKRGIQFLFFIFFVFALSRLAFEFLPRFVVSLSPSIHIGNIAGIVRSEISLLLILPSAILIAGAFIFNKRIFCFFVCPVGFMQDVLPSFKKRGAFFERIPKINYLIFISAAIVSVYGINLLGLLDPLMIFARFMALFQKSFSWQALWFGFPLFLILCASIYIKRVWCFRICPLGTFFDICSDIKSSIRKTSGRRPSLPRRQVLISLMGGCALLFLGKRSASNVCASDLIRPPGALPEPAFKDACIRCGNCMKACITDGLQPVVWESGWDGLGTPRLVPRIGECDEYCTRCGEACPTGAIRALSREEKRNERIGIARVNKETCLGWNDRLLCFICAEFCPYLAISADPENKDVPCPVVSEELCRGCGICEKQCPTHAIRVFRRE